MPTFRPSPVSCGLAYALALIGTDDYQSVTPGWVLFHYPEVEHIIYMLCHTCTDGCSIATACSTFIQT